MKKNPFSSKAIPKTTRKASDAFATKEDVRPSKPFARNVGKSALAPPSKRRPGARPSSFNATATSSSPSSSAASATTAFLLKKQKQQRQQEEKVQSPSNPADAEAAGGSSRNSAESPSKRRRISSGSARPGSAAAAARRSGGGGGGSAASRISTSTRYDIDALMNDVPASSSSSSSAGASAASPSAGAGASGEAVPRLPLDWTIKTGARFTADASFAWTKNRKPADTSAGLSRFVRSHHGARETTNARGGAEQSQESLNSKRFQQALMYYKHPAMPWPSSMAKIMGVLKSKARDTLTKAEATDLRLMEESQRDWGEAFESLYHSMRNKHCPYFYVQTMQFTVLFTAPGIRGSSNVSAVLSQSTKKLRQSLMDEVIPFQMPLAPEYAELTQRDLKEAEELAAIEANLGKYSGIKTKTIQTATNIDSKPKSMLTFTGHFGVHGLFEFLLNRKYARNGRLSLPTLLSPTAFENSTLRSLRANYTGALSKIGGNLPRRRTVQMSQAYALELEGPILPHSYFKLHQLLEETQDSQFNAVYLTSDATHTTVGLNCFRPGDPSSESEVADAAFELGGASYGMTSELSEFLASARPIGARSLTKTRSTPDNATAADLTAPQIKDGTSAL